MAQLESRIGLGAAVTMKNLGWGSDGMDRATRKNHCEVGLSQWVILKLFTMDYFVATSTALWNKAGNQGIYE